MITDKNEILIYDLNINRDKQNIKTLRQARKATAPNASRNLAPYGKFADLNS